MPDDLLEDIVFLLQGDLKVTREELEDLALEVVNFRDGRLSVPTPEDFLQARTTGREAQLEYAKQKLRSLIVFSITHEGVVQARKRGLKQRLGHEVNQLAFFLGQPNGRELVKAAFGELTTAERIMLFKTMSTNLKHQFEYPDLEECDETQMAEYICRAAYVGHAIGTPRGGPRIRNEEVFDRLETLVATCITRMEEGFDIFKVVSVLSELDYARDIFWRMIEAGYWREFLDQLECFFQQNPGTALFARRCQNILLGLEKEPEMPKWMRET